MAKRKSMAGGEIIREAQIYDVAVIGGGAAGSMAACAASEGGARTLILEANDRIGRKICATGNGRCNLTNLHVDENCYHTGGGEDLSAFFARFSVEDNIRFWESTTGTDMFTPGQTRRLRSRMLLTKYCARREQRSSPEAGLSM